MSQANPTKAEINRYSESFVLYGDMTRAARAAFPKSKAKGISLNEIGCRLHKIPDIQSRIKELQIAKQEIADREFNINATYVLRRLHEIDSLDVIDIVTDDLSAFKPLNEWPKAWRTSISSIDIKRIVLSKKEDGIAAIVEKVKWPDKTKNLELIGKHASVKAFGDELGTPANPVHSVHMSTDEYKKARQEILENDDC